jgi:hypothetical protein
MSEPIPVGLLRLLEALDASSVVLRRDMWRDEYAIRGRRGHIYPDGTGYLLYVTMEERGDQQPSAKRWNLAKQRLSFCWVTQDGDWEGCLHLDRLPTPDEAATIRDVLRIRRRRQLSEADRQEVADRLRRAREVLQNDL